MERNLVFLLCWCLLNCSGASLQAQAQTEARTAITADPGKLPPALREKGAELLKQADERERVRRLGDLTGNLPALAPFLLDLLEHDPSARVRLAIINRLASLADPAVRQAFERHARSDPDTNVALAALDKLRAQQVSQTRKIVNQRYEMAKSAGDEEAVRLLSREDERWISLVRGTMLPSFLRTVPAQFAVKPSAESIRVLAFGDYGTGSEHQKRVAAAMLAYHRKAPFDFAVTLGDNFYSLGMESPDDPRWKTWWEALYRPIGIHFYASMGNHDWGLPDSPAAEILYSAKSSTWRMPAPYYTYTAGPVQFFALDTNEMSLAQLTWLKEELEKSGARWKVVYGHHPVYSYGAHKDNSTLIAKLLPVLKGRADVYLAGHDHDLQHIQPEGGVHFFVSGGGGAGIRPITAGPKSLFAKSAYGFAVLEAGKDAITVRFIGTDLAEFYRYKLTEAEAASGAPGSKN